MKEVMRNIEQSREELRQLLRSVAETGGLTEERYGKYLSMQYHLTKGVQKHFLSIAAHPEIIRKTDFRNFLIDFAIEEEPHYQIAQADLKELGYSPFPIPFEVELWWAYFDSIVQKRPLVRLGATCILENITTGLKEEIDAIFSKAKFITPRNTRFLAIHRHEALPHGAQILEALEKASLKEAEIKDLEEGSLKGRQLFLLMLKNSLAC